MKTNFNTVKEYIDLFPEEVQLILQKIRQIICEIAPLAQESIAYQMPAYKVNGKPLVYFAAYKKHIGLYATPTTHKQFAELCASYKQGKGSIQFPIDQAEIPYNLISQMVTFNYQNLLHQNRT